ncbi:MAG: SRPBCC family protein [Rhodocyclales bacterium]|nr:SRPBCC family protein [Rhodocyclales bacterium]
MSTISKTISVRAGTDQVWDAVRDIGALHRRLVPGFVVATQVEAEGDTLVRIVTFGNGTTVREPILSCDDDTMRVAWTVEGGLTSHYNASVQVFAGSDGGARVVWIADFLPAAMAPMIDAAMSVGAAAMRKALGALSETPA